MNIQKTIITLIFTLFALTGIIAANENNPFTPSECRPFVQLNKTMQAEVQLTNEQFESIWTLNQKYWLLREEVLNNSNKIGKNTALLACWDKWQKELSTYLTKPQMEKFMQWQSQVDILSEMPY